MTSLDKLQQTIQSLNAIRGATLSIQSTIDTVTSIARDAFSAMNQGANNLVVDMKMFLSVLQSAMSVSPTITITPIFKVKAIAPITPSVDILPTLNVKPTLNLEPILNVKPMLNVTPTVNIAPSLNINPSVNITPTLNVKPTVNIKPTLNFKPTLNIAPTINVSPKIKVKKVSIIGSALNTLKSSMVNLFKVLRVAASGFFTVLRVGILSVLPAIFAFTVALLANPITWVVLGIVALVAALVGLIVYWDEVTAAVSNFFSMLGGFVSTEIFEPLKTWWNDFTAWLGEIDVFAAISEGWEWIKALFAENTWLQTAFFPIYAVIGIVDYLLEAFNKIPEWWDSLKKWLSSLNPFGAISNGIKKFAGIFGFSFGGDKDASKEAIEQSVIEQESLNKAVTLPGTTPLVNSNSEPLMQSISNEFGGKKQSTQVDRIEVHNHGAGVRGADLAYELEMAAG